jgi:hypothetical protein
MNKNIYSRPLIFILFVVILSTAVPRCGVASSLEKGSFITEVEGCAYFSDDKTLRQTRLEAEMDAKRKAVESARVEIKSQTKVEDFQVTYDLILSRAEAGVRVLEMKDLGLDNGNRYRVIIKAEVTYSLKERDDEKAQPPWVEPSYLPEMKEGPLFVKAWTDKPSYHEGEMVKISFVGNKDFYLYLVYQETGGNAVQLMPNLYRPNNVFKGGTTYSIPERRDGFSFRVQSPFGKEKIMFYASTSPIAEFNKASGTKESFLNLGKQGLEVVGDQYRGLAVFNDSKKITEFYESSLDVYTRRIGGP